MKIVTIGKYRATLSGPSDPGPEELRITRMSDGECAGSQLVMAPGGHLLADPAQFDVPAETFRAICRDLDLTILAADAARA